MSLLLLRATPHVSIYHDQANDWLFIDWQGDADLPAVELACLELAQVFLQRPYWRVLTSNAQVTSTSWDVPAWLARKFLPYLQLAGVEQLAWVSGRSARAHDVVRDIAHRLPTLPITVFDDLESAVGWLQRTNAATCPRPPAIEVQLMRAIREFTRSVLAQLHQRLEPA